MDSSKAKDLARELVKSGEKADSLEFKVVDDAGGATDESIIVISIRVKNDKKHIIRETIKSYPVATTGSGVGLPCPRCGGTGTI